MKIVFIRWVNASTKNTVNIYRDRLTDFLLRVLRVLLFGSKPSLFKADFAARPTFLPALYVKPPLIAQGQVILPCIFFPCHGSPLSAKYMLIGPTGPINLFLHFTVECILSEYFILFYKLLFFLEV